jgi:hypothetical protein
MATTFYLRNLDIAVDSYKYMDFARGESSTTFRINTIAGSSSTNGTENITGLFFVTRPLKGFTLSGTVTLNVRARESVNVANASVRCWIRKWSPSTGLGSRILTLTQTQELTTSDITVNVTGTPTSTAFADGDILVIETGITNWGGTMTANNRFVDYSYNGGTAGDTGDSYVTITEDVIFRDKIRITT